MRSLIRRILAVIVACTLLASLPACEWPWKSSERAAIDALNNGVSQLDLQSTRWEKVLEETRDKLIEAGQSTLANEVSNVIAKAETDAGIEAKCFVDFLRLRAKNDLIQIRAALTHEQPTLQPVFCNPTPDIVDLALAPQRRPAIEISGFNLSASQVAVYTVSTSGRTDVSRHLANPSEYLLTLNLGSNGVPLGPQVDKIEFHLSDGQVRSVTVVQLPPDPPKPDYPQRVFRVTGVIDMNDDEWTTDENKHVVVNRSVVVTAGQQTVFRWADCVGGEVQGYLDISLTLDRSTGTIASTGTARYYEGTRCGQTDLQGQSALANTLRPGEAVAFRSNLSDSDGGVFYSVTFENAPMTLVNRAHR